MSEGTVTEERRRNRRWWWPSSMIGQLVAGTVLVQAVVLAVFLVSTVHTELRQITARSHARMEDQAQLLAGLLTQPLMENDRAEMRRLADAMRSSPTVTSTRITDLDGNTMVLDGGQGGLDNDERAALALAAQTNIFHTFLRDDGDYEGLAAVHEAGKPLAVVFIQNGGRATQMTLQAVVRSSIVYSMCALAASVFLIALVTRGVTRSLRVLNRATQQVMRDSANAKGFPLPVLTRSEAGQLTHSFNSMVKELDVQRSGLNETLALLDSMLQNAPVGLAFFDREHRFMRANGFLEKMYDFPSNEYVGKTMRSLLPGKMADEVEELVEHVFLTGEDVQDRELKGTLASGQSHSWICNFYPVRTGSAHVRWVGMVMTDVTNRQRAEEAMRKSEKLAAAGRLAASIAHEINNPLESVTNLLYLLRQSPSLDSEASEFALLAQKELSRVSEITQQTLRFYRQSSKPEQLRLADIVTSVLSLHGARMQGAGVRVDSKLDAQAEMFGFAGELRQVLANLVGNAVDAMPKGGTLRVRVRRLRRSDVEGLCVTVADTGTGMSEEVRQHILEPFYTTKEATGTGLGLWVSDEIIRKHTGHLAVRSRVVGEGQASGSVFRIFFPDDGLSMNAKPTALGANT